MGEIKFTNRQISAAIAYLDPPSAPEHESIQLESYRACAEQLRAQVMRLERQLANARFAALVAAAASALLYAAWWASR